MKELEAFSRLGIPRTKDITAIKQAYQKLVPRYHPEVDPQGFMLLHDAYKTAMAYAKGTETVTPSAAQPLWTPPRRQPSGDSSPYDALFSELSEETPVDLPRPKKQFSLQLLRLKLHWLPIPVRQWQKLFSSDAFLLCRGDQECLEKLFDLLVRKIHTYGVMVYLIDQLWELDSWLKGEAMETLSNKTQSCIAKLHKQYSHYQDLPFAPYAGQKILPWLWYYQAVPFYFKLFVSTPLIPLLCFGVPELLLLLLLLFYGGELYIFIRKSNRKMGIFHPKPRVKRGVVTYQSIGESGWVICPTIHALIMHFFFCFSVFEKFWG